MKLDGPLELGHPLWHRQTVPGVSAAPILTVYKADAGNTEAERSFAAANDEIAPLDDQREIPERPKFYPEAIAIGVILVVSYLGAIVHVFN